MGWVPDSRLHFYVGGGPRSEGMWGISLSLIYLPRQVELRVLLGNYGLKLGVHCWRRI